MERFTFTAVLVPVIGGGYAPAVRQLMLGMQVVSHLVSVGPPRASAFTAGRAAIRAARSRAVAHSTRQ